MMIQRKELLNNPIKADWGGRKFQSTGVIDVMTPLLHNNDAIDTNQQGGKQSHLEYAFELMEPEFMLRVAHVLWQGKQKYGARNWQNIPMDENIGRAIYHLEQALLGQDHSEDHFANAACRVMFAMLTANDADEIAMDFGNER